MSDMSWALPWNWGPAGQQYGAQAAIDANLAANAAAQAANAAAVQQASYAAAAPTGTNNVYNSPVPFGDYNYGRVGGYPSFGEASGGGGGGGSTATPYDQYGPSWDGGGGGGNDLYFDGVSFVRRSATGGTNYDEPFSGRFGGAEQPQLPSQITDGGYPSFDSRWNQIADPYYNTPLNNALWQRGDNAGPQMPPQYQPPPQSTGGDDLYFDGVSFVRRSATGGATGYQRDAIAQEMMRSSIPSRPTANQGYNPGMENSFANPTMRQYDPQSIARQYEEILRGIDQGTANQNLDPSWFGPGATDPGGRSFQQDYSVTPYFHSGGG